LRSDASDDRGCRAHHAPARSVAWRRGRDDRLLLMESGLHAPGPPGGLRGRTGECGLLDDLVSAVRRGESRSVVLRGEAGIGKTALLEYLVASASDLRVVRAVGVESDMELAFASLHQLCSPLLDRIEELPAPQRRALETVFGLSDGAAPDRFLVRLQCAVLNQFHRAHTTVNSRQAFLDRPSNPNLNPSLRTAGTHSRQARIYRRSPGRSRMPARSS
jgi:AAA ATPase domain